MKSRVNIEYLKENDTFFLEGKKYVVTSNENISSSYNELLVTSQGEEYNLRLRKTQEVWINEGVEPIANRLSGCEKIRNEKGNLIAVRFGIQERKLSKDEIKQRDKCAKKLLGNDRFVADYGDDTDNMNNTAYGTCTNRAKGIKNKSNKEKTNESFERLDTIRKAIRRTSE